MGRFLVCLTLAVSTLCGAAQAQGFSALARLIVDQSQLVDDGDAAVLRLTLSQGVPFRVYSLVSPQRIVIDFNEVDFTGLVLKGLNRSRLISDLRAGPTSPGWSRMVLDLLGPMAVTTAALTTNAAGVVQVLIRLQPIDEATFVANAGAPPGLQTKTKSQPNSPTVALPRQTGDRPLVVVLDPGHGGIDPGAERGDAVESDLMLTFALELKELLLRAGGFKVVLTRDADVFVPLEARVSIARSANADVFLSLHADALIEGRASGSTVYTLSERASDFASQKLAERHDRSDLLAGVDLSDQDDVIATVLMDLARTETAPRSDNLANALVDNLSKTIEMHKRSRLSAGFSVLKAPDIPSVLLELGFLSSERDRKRLIDREWRGQAAIGIKDALEQWAISDAATALLLRK